MWGTCGVQGYLAYGNNINEKSVFQSIGNFTTPLGETPPAGTESFQSGFAASGGGWTLSNGGTLNGLNLNISRFRTLASQFAGGLEIQVDVQTQPGYSGPPLTNLFWIQSLLINYRPTDPGNAIHHVLDDNVFNEISSCTTLAGSAPTSGAGTFCGPVYPYQYSDTRFYDFPQGLYPIDSMRGIALLATVDAQSKNVTVFNGGISYGYDAWVVPEPSTLLLSGCGILLLVWRRRRA